MKRSIAGILVALPVVLVCTSVSAAGQGGRAANGMSFEQIDTNGDGEITRAEATAIQSERFDRIDTDGNGYVSMAEMEAAAEARGGRHAGRIGRMVERLDQNGDGQLSAAEMPGLGNERMFSRIDADGDGVITRTEAEDARGRFGGRRAAGISG